MAEKVSYPQIPTTLWWSLRQLLRKSPNATVDESFLAVNLNVQPAAARQYVTELRRVGLLTEEGRATPVAMKWRNDETYREAADELLRLNYPQSLLDVAPPGEADRTKVINWFMHNGLGEGTARNKTATFLLMANDAIQETPDARVASSRAPVSEMRPTRTTARAATSEARSPRSNLRVDAVPLNVNIQIHISADASSEQIETIFSSMRRYLYDDATA